MIIILDETAFERLEGSTFLDHIEADHRLADTMRSPRLVKDRILRITEPRSTDAIECEYVLDVAAPNR